MTNVGEKTITFIYKNWRGEIKERKVKPLKIKYQQTKYHPKAQWILEAFCYDKKEIRDFAIKDILTRWQKG